MGGIKSIKREQEEFLPVLSPAARGGRRRRERGGATRRSRRPDRCDGGTGRPDRCDGGTGCSAVPSLLCETSRRGLVRARRRARRLAGPKLWTAASTGVGRPSGGGPAGPGGRPCRRHRPVTRDLTEEEEMVSGKIGERERERGAGRGGGRLWSGQRRPGRLQFDRRRPRPPD